jgi:hypothetical protein
MVAVLLAMVMANAAAASAPPRPLLTITQERSVVFAPGDCDTTGECYPFFRIPAIKRAKSGALLAFAEARGGHSGSGSDHGDVQIVVRKSADGSGANGTWGKIHKVAFEVCGSHLCCCIARQLTAGVVPRAGQAHNWQPQPRR